MLLRGKAGITWQVVIRGTPVPPYRQLAEILRNKISSGELAPGTMLPSIMKLSEQYEMSTFTVKKALALLKDEGLITGVTGYGTFVAEPG